MEHLPHFAPLASRYDGFIIDVWGVIHDGVTAFPDAANCLRKLRSTGKRTLLLSNVPRPKAPVQEMLRIMGIADDSYTDILTSGEAVRRSLLHPPDIWWRSLGTRVFHLGPVRDRPIIEGLPLLVVDSPSAAHFVLNTGPDDVRNPTLMAEFEPILQECAQYRLPMVCANPDLEVIRGGVRVLCAGALAARYQELGGQVRSLGKPDPVIYSSALESLGLGKERTLVVGDSLRTDIAGAAAAGLPSCWVLSGLHFSSLMLPDGSLDLAKAEAEASALSLRPVASVPRFAW